MAGESKKGGGREWLAPTISAGAQVGNTLMNQFFAEKNRERNFYWNEKAADNADKRRREFYADIESPKAQVQQLLEAGLSPSLMYGDMGGSSGTAAPQGAGVSGAYPSGSMVDPKALAEIELMQAQTKNINEDTVTTEIQNNIKKLSATRFEKEWNLLNTTWYGKGEDVKSLSDLANNSEDYEQFQEEVYKILKDTNNTEMLYVKTEEGQKILREIYKNNKSFGNDIAVLANSKENAQLMLQVTNLLNQNGFASESADAQLKQLRQVTESAELTTEQKGAMNRLIDKMGHNTTSDILLVLLMMLGQYSHANLNFGTSQSTLIKK